MWKVVDQLLSTADAQCRKHTAGQIKSTYSNIYCVSPTDMTDAIRLYERTEESPSDSMTHMQQIGETSYKKNRYSLVNTSFFYPDHWCPTSVFTRSPYYIDWKNQSEQVIKDWYVSALGNNLLPSMEEKLWRVKPAEWSAFLQPYAANTYLEVMGKFLIMLILIDDYLIEQEAIKQQNIGLEQLLLFSKIWKLALERRNGDQRASKRLSMEIHDIGLKKNVLLLKPCFHLWSSIADIYVKLGAEETWCNRMANAMDEWFVSAIREGIENEHLKKLSSSTDSLRSLRVTSRSYNILSSQQATNISMSEMALLKTFMQQRINTIGVPMLSLLLEESCGINLVSVESLLRPLINIIAMITALINESVGMARDLRGEPNFLLAYRQIFNCSLQESIHFTITLHDLAIKTFDQQVAEILESLEFSSSRHHMSVFFERLRILARGFGTWHHRADRFKALLALDGTHKKIFLFSVADKENQRSSALHETLQQYKLRTMNI